MRIIIDAFGGDNAPLEVIKGAVSAAQEYGVTVVLVGDEEQISKAAQQANIALKGVEIHHAPDVMPVEADPAHIRTTYKNSSMAAGLRLLAEGKGDAFVSAGSTGALLMGATFIVKRIKGIKRPALGTMMPLGDHRYYLLIDGGANHECRADMLVQFGVMGSLYYQQMTGTASPKVGLVNIGTEETKGTDLQIEAYQLLKSAPLNFIGNVEAREIPLGGCDVAVCDGFTGNIILKLSEGFASFFSKTLKSMFMQSIKTKLAAVMMKNALVAMKKSMDYKEHGGAPILGVQKPVIKAHGSSDALAFKNAIRQAVMCVKGEVCSRIEEGIAAISAGGEEE